MDYKGKIITKNPVEPSQTSAPGVWTLDDATQAIKENNWPIANVPNPISRSLRFNDGDSAYLSRTPASASNRRTWTWSGWVKRCSLTGPTSTNHTLMAAGPWTSGNQLTTFRFQYDSDAIKFESGVYGSSTDAAITTAAVFRDMSAWYHVVCAIDTTQATDTNRVKIYVNGVLQTVSGTYPTQNYDTAINSTLENKIGTGSSTELFDGYMTEVHFVDGTALDASYFGMTDPRTGAWIPKVVSGITYGTNGFYLNFSDNSTTAALGTDSSGNNNTWTANNFSVTAGSGNDSMVDVPTPWIPYNTTGDVGGVVRGNYATLNPIADGSYFASGQTLLSLSNGNLNYGTAGRNAFGTIAVSSGKWYLEAVNTSNTASAVTLFGLVTVASRASVYGVYYNSSNGNKGLGTLNSGASETSYGATWTDNDVIGIALDMDAATPTVTFYKNGSSQGAISVSSFAGQSVLLWIQNGANSGNMAGYANFGQRPFAYTPPAGFLSLCTTNLPEPTILDGGSYFNTVLWTGDGGSTRSLTGVGFQPDFSWLKSRSEARNHTLYDSVRGAGSDKALSSSTTDPEGLGTTAGASASFGYVSSFDSDGFSVSSGSTNAAYVNVSAETYVAWNWKESATSGFDIVTYTGNGTGQNINHSLGVAPNMIIVKRRDTGGSDWTMYHSALPSAAYAIYLNLTDAAISEPSCWNSTAPTSTVFTVGTRSGTNANAGTFVAYLFAAVPGFSAIGSYVGNYSTDGPFVYTGFRPKWLMVKHTGGLQDWTIVDSSRSTYNVTYNDLYANQPLAEQSDQLFDFTSNGFKVRGANNATNASGGTIIYAAFAENPFKYSNAR